MKSKNLLSIFKLALTLLIISLPNAAMASGIPEFSEPMQKVVDTITGQYGQLVSIAGMAMCGVVYIFSRQDMGEGFKMLLQVVLGICFIAFASTIVTSMFSFSGAVI